MPDMYSKCGINCGRCPWSRCVREALKTEEEYQRFRDRCKMVLGFRPSKFFENCLRCQTPDDQVPKESRIPLRNCLVRQCVIRTGILNCAHCSRFSCGHIKEAGTVWTREKIEAKRGALISDEDHFTFVEPFEGLKHLEAIRASLTPEKIVEAVRVPLETKIVDFPERLHSPKNEILALKAVYQLLAGVNKSSFGLSDTDTFANQQKLKRRRSHFLRFLWIFGRFGELKEENGQCLVVDAKTYMANRGSEKTLASWPFVENTILTILPEFGVRCSRVTLRGVKETALTTGSGYLRDKGWVMKMTLDEDAGGVNALKTLQNYTAELDERYGKKAFKYFENVDMRILSEN